MTEHHNYELKMIPAKSINVNRTYQRGEQTSVIKQIVNHFDYHLVNAVKVTMGDDGLYYAWDGQQTAIGLRTKFGGDYLVPCFVYYDVPSWVDAAQLFEKANDKKFRKAVSSIDCWRSKINRNEEDHVFMKTICEQNGLVADINRKGHANKNGYLRCFDALDKVIKDYGRDVFAETISIIASAWHGEPNSLKAFMIYGMSIFVSRYQGEYNKNRLISKLSKKMAIEIHNAGRMSAATGNSKYAREILEIYNSGAQTNRLPNKL